MRAPDRATRSVDEIVRACVEKLAAPDADSADLDVVEASVRIAIRKLRTLNPLDAPLWGYRAENVKALESIRDQVKALRDGLASTPPAALLLLFAQAKEIRDEDIPTLEAQEKITSRLRVFTAALRHLQRQAEQLINGKPGKHGNAGFRQELAATEAWDFLKQRGKQPANSGSEASIFHQVTSLFYEAMTGEAYVDLTNACREVHRRKSLLPKKPSKKDFKADSDT